MFFSPDSEVLPEQADGDPTGPDDVRVLQTARGEDLISFILVPPLLPVLLLEPSWTRSESNCQIVHQSHAV